MPELKVLQSISTRLFTPSSGLGSTALLEILLTVVVASTHSFIGVIIGCPTTVTYLTYIASSVGECFSCLPWHHRNVLRTRSDQDVRQLQRGVSAAARNLLYGVADGPALADMKPFFGPATQMLQKVGKKA